MSLVVCHILLNFSAKIQKNPKVGAKNCKNYPKYYPKPKVGAKISSFSPKVGAS
jgi:hypothetical protein